MPDPSHKQAHQVAKHLLDVKDHSLSMMEAVALYRISSLTKVVSVLRDRYNWNIRPEWKNDHTGKRYRRYNLGCPVGCPNHQPA